MKHVEHLQECCFYGGKSPCVMQRARQGLLNFLPSKIQPKMYGFLYKSDPNIYKSTILVLGGLGFKKKRSFFPREGVGVKVESLVVPVIAEAAPGLPAHEYGSNA